MSPDERPDLDRVHALMMAALDDECSGEELRELESWLEASPQLAEEFRRLRRLQEVTTTMTLTNPPEEIWDDYRVSALHRMERSVAWVLLAFGAAVVGGWGLWHWLADLLDSDVPLLIKAAVVALVAGGLLLLVSVVRERWVMSRRDPYSRGVTR